MKLRELLDGTTLRVRGADTVEVSSIVIDSKKVTPMVLFVAVKGIALDGHDFLPEAVERGATSLVVEDATRVPSGFDGAVVVVPNARDTLNLLASRFFGDPARSLFCVGVTGTDGKTTVAWMVEAVLAGGGIPTGVIGTVDHHFAGHVWPGDTTPPPLVLQERIARFRELGAGAIALEATSQGLSQSRVGSVPFDVAVFTNLTRDHLDYHQTLESYFGAKERLFTEALAASPKSPRFAIVNTDTQWGSRIRVPSHATKWTYGRRGSGSDLEYEVVRAGLSVTVVRLVAFGEEAELRLPMLGPFNAANAIAAIAVGAAAGVGLATSVEALSSFAGVPGRVQRIIHPGKKEVIVDYAHDPDAFEKLLSTVRAAMGSERPQGRLVTVFGCGGDRDRGKRPLMLEAALRSSDRVVVTSDNPRGEDPGAIVDEILGRAGSPAEHRPIVVELDRTKAIHLALDSTSDNDVIMILGKGHEPYQLIGDQRVSFSDVAVAEAKLGSVARA